jgi:hypothetical protein
VNVRVVEAGQDQPATSVDNFGLASPQRSDFVVAACGCDPLTGDRNGCYRRRLGRAKDAPVENNEVGRSRPRVSCGYA